MSGHNIFSLRIKKNYLKTYPQSLFMILCLSFIEQIITENELEKIICLRKS